MAEAPRPRTPSLSMLLLLYKTGGKKPAATFPKPGISIITLGYKENNTFGAVTFHMPACAATLHTSHSGCDTLSE